MVITSPQDLGLFFTPSIHGMTNGGYNPNYWIELGAHRPSRSPTFKSAKATAVRWLRGPVPTSIKRSARSNCRNPSLCTSAIGVVMMGCCWMSLGMFVVFFVSNFFVQLYFPGYTYPDQTGRIWPLGIASFLCLPLLWPEAILVGTKIAGKQEFGATFAYTVATLSTFHQNGWHYDIKPSSSVLTRFMVIRKKIRPCFAWWSVNIFFMKLSSLTACLKTWARMQLVWKNTWLWLLSSEMIASKARLLKYNDIYSTRDVLKTFPSLNCLLNYWCVLTSHCLPFVHKQPFFLQNKSVNFYMKPFTFAYLDLPSQVCNISAEKKQQKTYKKRQTIYTSRRSRYTEVPPSNLWNSPVLILFPVLFDFCFWTFTRAT